MITLGLIAAGLVFVGFVAGYLTADYRAWQREHPPVPRPASRRAPTSVQAVSPRRLDDLMRSDRGPRLDVRL